MAADVTVAQIHSITVCPFCSKCLQMFFFFKSLTADLQHSPTIQCKRAALQVNSVTTKSLFYQKKQKTISVTLNFVLAANS